MKKRRKRPPMAPEQLQRHIGRLRIGDLNKLFGDRYGGGRVAYEFPDDDAGREDLEIIAHHYAINAGARIFGPRRACRAHWVSGNSSWLKADYIRHRACAS